MQINHPDTVKTGMGYVERAVAGERHICFALTRSFEVPLTSKKRAGEAAKGRPTFPSEAKCFKVL